MKSFQKMLLIAIALSLLFVLAACGQSQTTDATTETGSEKYIALTANSEGNVVIPTETVSTSATYYNYDASGVTVQLVAIRDAEGKAHISFNTCQSCSPSPKAYFFQQGSVLQCANCGFTFAPAEVGVSHGGCNPWPIDSVNIGTDDITIPAAALDNMRDKFASWQGPAA